MEGKANKESLWRRCWRSMGRMELWNLTLLFLIPCLILWGLLTILLPYTVSYSIVLILALLVECWAHIKTKGMSVRRRSRRKDSAGAVNLRKGLEGSTESELESWEEIRKKAQEWWDKICDGEGACSRELHQETGATAQAEDLSAASISELLRNHPCMANMEELIETLMDNLDITQICLDLLEMLKEHQDSGAPDLCGAIRKEYLTCLRSHRCLTGNCQHHSEPLVAQGDLQTLAVCLRTVDRLGRGEDTELELGLGFELATAGEPIYVWERTQRLPKTALERFWGESNTALARSPGDSKSSQPPSPVPSAWGTPKGQTRLAMVDTEAPCTRQSRAQCRATSTTNLWPAGYMDSVPTEVPTWPLPPWAQPLSPAAMDRLQRAGMEPLPRVEFKGLGQGVSLQHICQSWQRLKVTMWRMVWDEQGQMWTGESSAPEGTTGGDQTLPLHVWFQADKLFHSVVAEA